MKIEEQGDFKERTRSERLLRKDIFMGALAREHDLDVLTVDEHCAGIPGLKRYRGERH